MRRYAGSRRLRRETLSESKLCKTHGDTMTTKKQKNAAKVQLSNARKKEKTISGDGTAYADVKGKAKQGRKRKATRKSGFDWTRKRAEEKTARPYYTFTASTGDMARLVRAKWGAPAGAIVMIVGPTPHSTGWVDVMYNGDIISVENKALRVLEEDQ